MKERAPQPNFEHIPEHSEDIDVNKLDMYKFSVEIGHLPGDDYYGYDTVLADIEEAREGLKRIGSNRSTRELREARYEYLSKLSVCEEAINNIFNNAIKNSNEDTIFSLASEIADSRILTNSILDKKSIKDTDGRKEIYLKIVDLLFDNSISTEIKEKILKYRSKKFKQLQVKFKEELPQLIHNVKNRIDDVVGIGALPITQERVNQCFANAKIVLADDFVETVNCDGAVNDATGVIKINSNAFEFYHEKVLGTLVHEFIHDLSGRTRLKITRTKADGSSKINIRTQRTGVEFTKYNKNFRIDGDKFKWLNEAITEEITILLTGVEEKEVYSDERKLLKCLYKVGLSKELTYQAYFENYNKEDPDRVPLWKEFYSELKKKLPEAEKLLFFEEGIRLQTV